MYDCRGACVKKIQSFQNLFAPVLQNLLFYQLKSFQISEKTDEKSKFRNAFKAKQISVDVVINLFFFLCFV